MNNIGLSSSHHQASYMVLDGIGTRGDMCTLPDLPGHGASALGEAAETELLRTRLPKKKGAISKTCPNSKGRRLHVEKDRNYRSLNNSHHYYCA